jgi:hypothetical protein
MKYHISPTTGNPNRCYANTKPCPIGGEGEHYSSKEEAREAFEASQGGSLSSVSRKGVEKEVKTPTDLQLRVAFNESFEDVITYNTSEATRRGLQAVANGKNVGPEKLDAMIDELRHTDKTSPYRQVDVSAGNDTLTYLRHIRSQDPTPNTLMTREKFDPSSQTMFSNSSARKNPALMAKPLARAQGHTEHLLKLADDAEEMKTWEDEDPEAVDNYIAELTEDASRSKAKVEAMLLEAQYLYKNDEDFAKACKPALRQQLARFKATQSTLNFPLSGVRPVKGK